MKKIVTKEQRARQVKRNQLIIGGALILLMVFSTLGYALSGRTRGDQDKKIEYKGIEFVQDSGYWFFQYNGNQFITVYNPEEVKDFPFFSYLSIESYRNQALYFAGEYGEPVLEISRNLKDFVSRMQNACIPDVNCTSEDLPVKNCSAENIIVIREPKENEKESIYQEENCVFIISSYQNQTKYADSFLFSILRI